MPDRMKCLHVRGTVSGFLLLVLLLISGCDILQTEPQGTLSRNILENEEGVRGALIAAYARLHGTGWYSSEDNWMWGSVSADDAYKGSSPGDQAQITNIERWEVEPINGGIWSFWQARYDGIARANDALSLMEGAEEMTEEQKTRVEAQARFLRAHYHFELKRMFNNIPYITEDLEDTRVPNTTGEAWANIEEDLQFAVEHLPLTQEDLGRPTKGAAQAYLGKVHLYQQEFAEAKPYFDAVIQGGQYHLPDCFHDSFNAETDNHSGAIFQVQASVNDGTGGSALGRTGAALNFPYGWGPGGCCGFFQPSQDLVNAFKSDPQTGLPMPDTYGDTDFKNDQGLTSEDPFEPDTTTPVDPRLDWTVGRRGVPYLDWGIHPGANAIRAQGFGGPYSPIKNVYYERQEGTLSTSSGGSAQHNANNYSVIRYADVLLLAAEVAVELGNPETAREYVNTVRRRAKEGCVVRHEDGRPAANYFVGLYEEPWSGQTKEWMRERVRFERRLELAMEGHRRFDLVRQEVALEVMNEYFEEESVLRPYLAGATAEQHERYYPIPLEEIERSVIEGEPTLEQNPGY